MASRFMVVVIALGLILGVSGAHALFLGGWTLVPWGLAGLILGYWARTRPVLSGAVYGFVLSVTFMVAGYSGTASLLTRLPFFALLGLFGALCGLVLTLAGSWARARVRAASGPPSSDAT